MNPAALTLTHATGTTPIFIGPGALRDLPAILSPTLRGRRVVIISDVQAATVIPAPHDAPRLTFPAGEASKTRDTWARLTDELLWNSGQLSRYDPRTGEWRQWKAPGARPRVYAVYVDETDKVWVSEWTGRVMLRFDPTTEKFEAFKSSSGTADVRQIHGRQGEIWTPESAPDKLVVYRFR